MLLSNVIIREARTYLGTRFRHQGRDRKSGVDCAGLILVVANAVVPGFKFDFTTYNRYPDGTTIMRLALENMEKIPIERAGHGDIFVMFDVDPAWPCHLAFVTTDKRSLQVLHAAAMRRKVVEHILSPDWKQKINAAFRFKGV